MASNHEGVDILSSDLGGLSENAREENSKPAFVDLTREPTERSSDHMQPVLDLLRSGKCPTSRITRDIDTFTAAQVSSNHNNDPFHRADPVISLSSDDDVVVSRATRRQSGKGVKPRRFPFLELPPEIRNGVYRILLTTPGTPIEFPRQLSIEERRRAEKCRKSSKSRNRAAHKRMFLEILTASRQIHDEATGIMYGCNVFKYRNGRGQTIQNVELPTCHLQLLKHIKISVVSQHPLNEQENRVADLVRCFTADQIRLDTFEFTWFGFQEYVMEWQGQLCRTLLTLKVDKSFTIKFGQRARIRKTAKTELLQAIRSRQVEVQLPKDPDTGRELDADEGLS